MIVTMQGSNSIGANSTTQNIISGQRYERSPFEFAQGNIYACGSALGLTLELNVGGTSITPPTSVNSQNRFPVVPDDVLVAGWEVIKNSLIQLTAVNTTAGALTIFWRIDLEEMNFGE